MTRDNFWLKKYCDVPGEGRLFFTMALLEGIWKMHFSIAITYNNIPDTVVLRKRYWWAWATWIWNRFSTSLSGVSSSGLLVLMMEIRGQMQSLAHHLNLGAFRSQTFCCNHGLQVLKKFVYVMYLLNLLLILIQSKVTEEDIEAKP